MSKTYTITLTYEQAHAAQAACELMARFAMGQCRDLACLSHAIADVSIKRNDELAAVLAELEAVCEHAGMGNTSIGASDPQAQRAYVVWKALQEALDLPRPYGPMQLRDSGPVPRVTVEEAPE